MLIAQPIGSFKDQCLGFEKFYEQFLPVLERTSLLKVGNSHCSTNNSNVMEQRVKKFVNNCLNINIYSYLETCGGQTYDLYLNVVHFLKTSLN